ncbi:sigma-70 family RNA polymerase sigma factor [Nitrospirillum sp. BR 11163]|uniref:sigma-70 family RNA polymerase sigma factor n=1 Tax=Nitrospirillum sp. BR 11163 TaxID=3104323 RepID=UPI002AFFBF5D|nr:sigma-70 family RNA polymerase sigma factor [Nitrospirillum sp. BR 11163]MEA1675180.1 sigma-70 family RNA polymerase sigma factor [Nitrospirillum sp. BR 11163]
MESRWAEAMRAERRGDAAAYHRFLAEAATLFRRVVHNRLGRFGLGTAETEDIVQEILIGLHTKRHTWDPGRPLMPWLHGIARYKFLDAARKLRREALSTTDLTIDDLADALAAPEEEQERTLVDVDRHIAQLPAGQQGVVRALAMDGLSPQATARRLNLSEGSVRVLFHRALKALWNAADPPDGPPDARTGKKTP